MTDERDDSGLVDRLERITAEFPSIPDERFDVTEYGADPTGESRSTDAIQDALDAAGEAGGGTVVLPEGTYLSGALFVPSDAAFRIAGGAVLRAVQDDDAFPNHPTRVAGIEMEWPAALVNVYDESNVLVAGEGTIDGNGEYWWEKFNDMRGDYEDRGLRWAVDYDCERVRPVVAYESADVRLRDFRVERQGFWAVTATYCERVHVDGLTVRGNVGGYGPSTDGINVDSSRDVLVEDCDVEGNDDCLCVKAGRDADGLRVDRPTENVVFRHCRIGEGGGLVTVGSETAGGVRNLAAYDIHGEGTSTGVRFKSAKVRGGTVENCRFRDLSVDGARTVLEWNLDWHPDYSYPTIPEDVPESEYEPHWETLTEPVEPPERGIPEFRDITVSNLRATNADTAFFVVGYGERPIRNVRLTDVDVEAAEAGSVAHAKDWTMNDVVVRTDDGEGVETTDCRDVDLPAVVPN